MRYRILTGLICTIGLAAAAVGEHGSPLLSAAEHNAKWSVGPDGKAAGIKGSQMERPTLSFHLPQLRRAPLAMVINSDTRRVTVEVGGETVRLETRGGEQTLVMDAGGKAPVLAFNGRAKAAWQEAWRAGLAADGAEDVTVRFAPCLFVKLTWQHGGEMTIPEVEGEVEGAGEEAGGDDDRGRRDRRRGGFEAEPPAKRGIVGSLVQLRIHHGDAPAVRLTPAVVVRRGGLAVTALHPLIGATKVEAKLFDRAVGRTLPVSVVGLDKGTDLALVRMDVSADPAARASLTPLSAAEQAPAEEAPLWVAHRVGEDLVLSGGPVKWAGMLGELGARSKAKLGYPETTRWALIEAESDRGYGMRPVVDQSGNLAGLAAWTWPMSGNAIAVLSAEHVEALIAGSDLAGEMRWAAVDEAAEGARWPYAMFPTIELMSTARARDLQRAVRVADRSHTCTRCDGKGHVLRRVTVGHRTSGGLRYPVKADKAFVCPRCEGDGLNQDEALLGGLRTLADAAARLDPSDERAREQLEAAASKLSEIGRKHFPALVALSRERAKALAASGPAAVGESVVIYGRRVRAGRRSGMGGEAGLVAVVIDDPTEEDGYRYRRRGADSGEKPYAAVLDGVKHGAEADGELAAVSGLLAGFVAREEGEPPLMVVSHAVMSTFGEGELTERETAEQWNEENLREAGRD